MTIEQLNKNILYQSIITKDLNKLTEVLVKFNNEIDSQAYDYFFNTTQFNYEDFSFIFFLINHPSFSNNDEEKQKAFYIKLFHNIYYDARLFDLFINSSLYNEQQFSEQFNYFIENNKLFTIHPDNYLKLFNQYNLSLFADDLMLIIIEDRIGILKTLFENNLLLVNEEIEEQNKLISLSLNSCSIHCFQYLINKYPKKIHINDIFTDTYTIDLFAKTPANKFFSYAINNFEWDLEFVSKFLPALMDGHMKNNYIEFTNLLFEKNNEEAIELIFQTAQFNKNAYFSTFFNEKILPKILTSRVINFNAKLEKNLQEKLQDQNPKSKI